LSEFVPHFSLGDKAFCNTINAKKMHKGEYAGDFSEVATVQ